MGTTKRFLSLFSSMALSTLLCFAVVLGCGQEANCQDVPAAGATSSQIEAADFAEFAEVAAGDSFHRSVIQAAVQRVRAGEMTRRELIQLRVAMISPSFRQHAKDLAIIQLSASGSPSISKLPLTETGAIDEAAVNWEGLIAFLKELVPLIITLIQALGGGAISSLLTFIATCCLSMFGLAL